ncbi:hypothetical protein UlMin_005166 [Ulmus minor]
MDFQQQKHQSGDLPFFCELLEVCDDSRISFPLSSEGKSSGYTDHEAKKLPNFSNKHQSKSTMGASGRSKERIKWTQDLHERFVECVNYLGGAEKATPRNILKLMDSNTLTIFHVKSHLQKYRTSMYIVESTKGKSDEKIDKADGTSQLDIETCGMQIKEVLQHVNKHLLEQSEIQQNLQLLIEEQGKQLKMILEQQQKANRNLFHSPMQSDYPYISFSDGDHASIAQDSGSSHFQPDLQVELANRIG